LTFARVNNALPFIRLPRSMLLSIIDNCSLRKIKMPSKLARNRGKYPSSEVIGNVYLVIMESLFSILAPAYKYLGTVVMFLILFLTWINLLHATGRPDHGSCYVLNCALKN
jgi:hypothetical protein